MKIFGTISELVKVAFRLSGGKEVRLEVNPTQTGSGPIVITIPDVGSNAANLVTTGDSGTITSAMIANGTIVDGDISNTAGIALSKLATGALPSTITIDSSNIVNGTIEDADISNTAAIGLSKLASGALPSAITVDSSNIVNGSITNDDVNASAAIAYSKLALSSSIVGTDIANNISLPGVEYGAAQNATLSSNTLSPSTGKIIHRITAGSTLDMIDTPTSGRMLVLVNAAGADITVNNATGATAANQIITGTGDSFTLLSGAAAVVTYNSVDSKWSLVSGGGGSGGGTVDNIVQASSFAVGDVLYLLGSTYTKAESSSASTGEVVGVISKVVVAGQKYQMTLAGEVSNIAASQFTEAVLPAAGTAIFLSATPGKMTITEPGTLGQVSVPLGVSLGGGAMYFLPKRGVVVGGTNARTQIPLSAVTTAQTIYTAPAGLDAGELTGWVYLDATTDKKFYVSAPFAKNGAGTDWNISPSYVGDTPPTGFGITMTSAGLIQLTMNPLPTGFVSGYINYALNAPAVGATFPLSVSGTSITGGTPTVDTINEYTATNGVQIRGRTSGVAIESGYVGEKRTWTSAPSSQTFNTTEADWTNATITLSSGIWLVVANIQTEIQSGGTAGNWSEIRVRITDSSNNIVQNMKKSSSVQCQATGTSPFTRAGLSFTFQAVLPSSQTYKIRGQRFDGVGTGTSSYLINDAAMGSEFFAIRIA